MTRAVLLRANVMFAVSLLAFCVQGRAQSLVYAVSVSDTRASLQARFSNGAIGAPINERLAMLRHYRKTEIYSVSMIDGKRSLLFSDEGMNFEITPVGSVSGANKAYITGVEREWRTAPVPGAYAEPVAIYEIRLDGSRQYRRLFETQPNQSPAILNSQGSKAAFTNFVNGKDVVSIYDVPAWKLLDSWDLTKITQAHCPYCSLMSFGWLADGHRLFFDVDIVDDEGEGADETVNPVPGIYLASEQGSDLGALSPDIGALHLSGYIHPGFVNHHLLGQLPDGSFVFQDHAAKEGHPMADLESFLVISSPGSRILPRRHGFGSSHLSPSGKYLAYIEERQMPNYRPEWHLWSQDLETGQEKDWFVAPSPNPPTSMEPNVTLTVLGWISN
jgi:hypothetical protein